MNDINWAKIITYSSLFSGIALLWGQTALGWSLLGFVLSITIVITEAVRDVLKQKLEAK